MRIDPAGLPFIAAAAVPAAGAAAFGATVPAIALLALPAAVALFFRDPDRASPSDPDLVLSPADGRVMYAGEPRPGEAPPGAWRQVTIFLSVLDVHINRTPIAGRPGASDTSRIFVATTRSSTSLVWSPVKSSNEESGASRRDVTDRRL